MSCATARCYRPRTCMGTSQREQPLSGPDADLMYSIAENLRALHISLNKAHQFLPAPVFWDAEAMALARCHVCCCRSASRLAQGAGKIDGQQHRDNQRWIARQIDRHIHACTCLFVWSRRPRSTSTVLFIMLFLYML